MSKTTEKPKGKGNEPVASRETGTLKGNPKKWRRPAVPSRALASLAAQDKELTPMAVKTTQAERTRLSKSRRTYVRRLKQAARKAGTPYRQPGDLPASR